MSQKPPAGCLSVVMPCYNEEKTILEVLGQVLAQPCVGEVVVVDDGSKDASVEKVRSLRDPRVKLLVQPRNFGKGERQGGEHGGGARAKTGGRQWGRARGDVVAVTETEPRGDGFTLTERSEVRMVAKAGRALLGPPKSS